MTDAASFLGISTPGTLLLWRAVEHKTSSLAIIDAYALAREQ
jgi:hypothetical protein